MDITLIKQLREETGAGVMDAKKALADSQGDYERAKQLIAEKGLARAEKRADRETKQGIIYSYIHGNGSVGVLLELNCETSFVAQTDEFKALAHEIALQIAAMKPETLNELLSQDYIRDGSKKIDDLIKELVGKTGENVVLNRFKRYELGE
jgi:elongation factor Ts